MIKAIRAVPEVQSNQRVMRLVLGSVERIVTKIETDNDYKEEEGNAQTCETSETRGHAKNILTPDLTFSLASITKVPGIQPRMSPLARTRCLSSGRSLV